MQIKNGQNPPNIDKIKLFFDLSNSQPCFSFAPDIYNPSGNPLNMHLLAHEMYHLAQQGDTPGKWWDRYLADPMFRASQEVPAYQTQYQSAKNSTKDRNLLHKYLVGLAFDLSGPMYGSIMSFAEAMEAIKIEQLFHFKT